MTKSSPVFPTLPLSFVYLPIHTTVFWVYPLPRLEVSIQWIRCVCCLFYFLYMFVLQFYFLSSTCLIWYPFFVNFKLHPILQVNLKHLLKKLVFAYLNWNWIEKKNCTAKFYVLMQLVTSAWMMMVQFWS